MFTVKKIYVQKCGCIRTEVATRFHQVSSRAVRTHTVGQMRKNEKEVKVSEMKENMSQVNISQKSESQIRQ